jgi:hypothetical protein
MMNWKGFGRKKSWSNFKALSRLKSILSKFCKFLDAYRVSRDINKIYYEGCRKSMCMDDKQTPRYKKYAVKYSVSDMHTTSVIISRKMFSSSKS